MAADIFLCLTGAATGNIKGESTTSGLEAWIEITSYDLSTTQAVEGSRSTSGAPTSGRADHEDVGFAKQMDAATPGLMAACCAGDIIEKADILHYSMVQNKKTLFAAFHMESVVITEVSLSGSDGVPEETLKINYGSIVWWYKAIDHTTGGAFTGAVGAGPFVNYWDVINNTSAKVGDIVSKLTI